MISAGNAQAPARRQSPASAGKKSESGFGCGSKTRSDPDHRYLLRFAGAAERAPSSHSATRSDIESVPDIIRGERSLEVSSLRAITTDTCQRRYVRVYESERARSCEKEARLLCLRKYSTHKSTPAVVPHTGAGALIVGQYKLLLGVQLPAIWHGPESNDGIDLEFRF